MKVKILTIERSDPCRRTHEKEISWMDRSDRKWLESHMHWAMMNDREVTISPTR